MNLIIELSNVELDMIVKFYVKVLWRKVNFGWYLSEGHRHIRERKEKYDSYNYIFAYCLKSKIFGM